MNSIYRSCVKHIRSIQHIHSLITIFALNTYIKALFELQTCLFVLWFYDPVNPYGLSRARSVYQTALFPWPVNG